MTPETDTYWSTSYMGTVIQGHHNRVQKREVIKALLPDGRWIECRTLRGAKARISRHIGGRPNF